MVVTTDDYYSAKRQLVGLGLILISLCFDGAYEDHILATTDQNLSAFYLMYHLHMEKSIVALTTLSILRGLGRSSVHLCHDREVRSVDVRNYRVGEEGDDVVIESLFLRARGGRERVFASSGW